MVIVIVLVIMEGMGPVKPIMTTPIPALTTNNQFPPTSNSP